LKRQRIAIAQGALIQTYNCWLMDEPLAALDDAFKKQEIPP